MFLQFIFHNTIKLLQRGKTFNCRLKDASWKLNKLQVCILKLTFLNRLIILYWPIVFKFLLKFTPWWQNLKYGFANVICMFFCFFFCVLKSIALFGILVFHQCNSSRLEMLLGLTGNEKYPCYNLQATETSQ